MSSHKSKECMTALCCFLLNFYFLTSRMRPSLQGLSTGERMFIVIEFTLPLIHLVRQQDYKDIRKGLIFLFFLLYTANK